MIVNQFNNYLNITTKIISALHTTPAPLYKNPAHETKISIHLFRTILNYLAQPAIQMLKYA